MILQKIKYVLINEHGYETQEIGVWLTTVFVLGVFLVIFREPVQGFIDKMYNKYNINTKT